MNVGSIWWGQIGNSIRLLTKISNNLRDCQSTILQIPQDLPWRQVFYDAIDFRRTSFSGDRRMVRLVWEEEENPGKFILDELCSSRVRADYWPGQSYAEYLGSRNDLLMNDYYVWIRNIHRKTDLMKWVEFVSAYHTIAKDDVNYAVFVLEYDGDPVDFSELEMITYTVENYDCRVFSLEVANALANTEIRNYQAELALSICRNNPELCYALLAKGQLLLQDPIQATKDVVSNGYTSEGTPFPQLDSQQIQSSAWEAAIILLFPILEHFRLKFVERNEAKLLHHLPINNSNGERVTEPCDLEIGALYYIVSSSNAFSVSDINAIRLCRKVRNLLAHNRIVMVEDVLSVLSLF